MTETIRNLTKAFIGESQARNRYTIYSKIAQKEGYEQIAELFLVTAENEREHAKWLFKLIQELKKQQKTADDEIVVEAASPNLFGDTATNLQAAIAGEEYEYTQMYPEFADVAQKEGFTKIAARLRSIAKAEQHHADRYIKLLKEVQAKTVFKKDKKVYWVCRKCGYVHEGNVPPTKCPSCDHPKNFFEIKCEQY